MSRSRQEMGKQVGDDLLCFCAPSFPCLSPIMRTQGVRKEEMAGETTMPRSMFPKFSERTKTSVDKGCNDMKELSFLFFSVSGLVFRSRDERISSCLRATSLSLFLPNIRKGVEKGGILCTVLRIEHGIKKQVMREKPDTGTSLFHERPSKESEKGRKQVERKTPLAPDVQWYDAMLQAAGTAG